MSSPLYEKRAARHDFIEIDGTDYSNSFQEMNLNSTRNTDDAGGFSVSGVDETVPAGTTQGFTGTFYVNDTILSALWVIHYNETEVLVRWRKNGLVDSSAPLFYGVCRIDEFAPTSTFGSVETSPVTFNIADANGIRMTGT